MNTLFPAWVLFGLLSTALAVTAMLLQEKFKVNGFALAFWNKVGTIAVVTPFMLWHGFPTNPLFYLLIFCSASLYAISDVAYFGGIGKVGAGPVSRVLPMSVIFSFLFWFAIDHQSFHKYMATPGITGAIFAVLCLWVYFATHMRKCAVSMEAAHAVWFVIFAAIVGPPLGKKILDLGTTDSIYAYVFFQALFMLMIWSAYYRMRRPIHPSTFFARHAWFNGTGIGLISGFAVMLGCAALYFVDNPAFATAISFLNALMILGVYRLMGRKSDGNVKAGIGMVLCAAALIILKSYIP